MENTDQVIAATDVKIKQELKDEYNDGSEPDKLPIKSLVLRFKKDKSGLYSVIPMIKPDPFFEEHLEDDFDWSEEKCIVKQEQNIKKEEVIVDTSLSTIAPAQESNEENNNKISEHKNDKVKKARRFQIIKCTKCFYKNNQTKVHRHMLRVHPRETLSCRFCTQKNFKEPIALEAHILKNHMDNAEAKNLITRRIYSCDFCKYRSLKTGNFRRHLTTHGKNKLINRLTNGKERSKISTEIKLALSKSSYYCYHCTYNSKDKGSIVKHLRLHRAFQYRPFICTVCDLNFNEKSSLDSHIIKRHFNNKELLRLLTNKVYECELCDYKDVNKSKVLRHKKARHIKKERKMRQNKRNNKFLKV